MSLLVQVGSLLSERGIAYAVIGAAALAIHGVSRATADGVTVEIRHGDAEDPLADVVRLAGVGRAALDLILGRSAWQRGVLDWAQPGRIEARSEGSA